MVMAPKTAYCENKLTRITQIQVCCSSAVSLTRGHFVLLGGPGILAEGSCSSPEFSSSSSSSSPSPSLSAGVSKEKERFLCD